MSTRRTVETNASLSLTEVIPDAIDVKTGVWGCERTGTDIMVTGTVQSDPRQKGEPPFYDLFLSRELARELHRRLGEEIDHFDKSRGTT